MTEKRFTNHDNTILDNQGEQLINTEEIVDKLNELHDENTNLKEWKKEQIEEYLRLKNVCNRLKRENEHLKQSYAQLKHKHSLLHDVCLDAEWERDSYRKDVLSLEKENEQLKKQNENLLSKLKFTAEQLNYSENLKKMLNGDVE